MLLFTLLACATIHAVTPGSESGEVYLTVAKWPLQRGFVVRCWSTRGDHELTTECARLVTTSELGALGPGGFPAGKVWQTPYSAPIHARSVGGAVDVDVPAGATVLVDGVASPSGVATAVSAGQHVVTIGCPNGHQEIMAVNVQEGAVAPVWSDCQ